MSTSVCHCELTEHKPLIYHTSLDTTYINSTEIPGEKHICCDKLCDEIESSIPYLYIGMSRNPTNAGL